jgi:hypothetical protein
LAKRRDVSDPTCIFCNEKESISHLVFDCCMASNVWLTVSQLLGQLARERERERERELLGQRLGTDFESSQAY